MAAIRLVVFLGPLTFLASTAFGQPTRPGADVSVPHASRAVQVAPADAAELLQCLLGPGVQVENVVLTAAPGSTGLF